ncbi:MAG: hypothetical protein AAFZ65_02340 [Planctomycetota bacterium]
MTASLPFDPAQRAAAALAEAARAGAARLRELGGGPRAEAWDAGRAAELEALAERFQASTEELERTDASRAAAADADDAARAARKGFDLVYDLGHGALAVLRLLARAAERLDPGVLSAIALPVDAAVEAALAEARRRAADLGDATETELRILAAQRHEAATLVQRLGTPLPPTP